MQEFAKSVFRLKKDGAAAIVVLHHSPKAIIEASELTLENVMRGSGELGAFLTSCWATRLVDPQNEYESPSYIRNVKQRDFKSDPFEATCDATCRMTYKPQEEGVVATLKTNGADKDGKNADARAYIKGHLADSAQGISDALKASGIKRSRAWFRFKRPRYAEPDAPRKRDNGQRSTIGP